MRDGSSVTEQCAELMETFVETLRARRLRREVVDGFINACCHTLGELCAVFVALEKRRRMQFTYHTLRPVVSRKKSTQR